MDLSALEKRIRAVELKLTPLRLNKGSSSGASRHSSNDTVTLLRELEELAHEIRLIREEGLAAGDHRLVLACISVNFVVWPN